MIREIATTTMGAPELSKRQKLVLTALEKKTRCGVALFARVWAEPPGSWPATLQAERQADDCLPAGIGFEEAMETVAAAGLVSHFHPDRAR